jgi:hypothetical protein
MAAKTEAGIVDKDINLLAGTFDIRDQLVCRSGDAEIHRGSARIAELAGQGIQPLFPPCYQNQPVAALRQLASELDS